MIFTKDLMRSTKVIFIGDVYIAVALRGLRRAIWDLRYGPVAYCIKLVRKSDIANRNMFKLMSVGNLRIFPFSLL